MLKLTVHIILISVIYLPVVTRAYFVFKRNKLAQYPIFCLKFLW